MPNLEIHQKLLKILINGGERFIAADKLLNQEMGLVKPETYTAHYVLKEEWHDAVDEYLTFVAGFHQGEA